MHIIGISGSPRPESVSSVILNEAGRSAANEISFTLYESLLDLPHFNPDDDTEQVGPNVKILRDLVRSADGVIICTPEYAFSIPSVLKNALEWMVSSGELYEKPLVSISTSPSAPGGDKAHQELRMVLKALGARIANDEMLCIGSTRKITSAEGEITDPATNQNIGTAVSKLIALVKPD